MGTDRSATGRMVAPLVLVGLVAVGIAVTLTIALYRTGKPGKAAAPAPSATVPGPITAVNWQDATVQFAAPINNGYCVQGTTTFRDGTATSDGNTVRLLADHPPVYGDLTGDNRPEAILFADCTGSEGTSPPELLVITQATDGALRQIDFIDPNAGLTGELSGGQVVEVDIAHGKLVVAVGTAGTGASDTYEWNGSVMRQTDRKLGS